MVGEDHLISELLRSGHEATPAEVGRILSRMATAPLDVRLVRVPGYLRGQPYGGRTLQRRDQSAFVHLVKRVRYDRQWAEDTTMADYLEDLRRAVRQPDAHLLIYARHGEHHAGVIADTDLAVPVGRRGELALPNLLVVYSWERRAIRTGYQFSAMDKVGIPGDARWLK